MLTKGEMAVQLQHAESAGADGAGAADRGRTADRGRGADKGGSAAPSPKLSGEHARHFRQYWDLYAVMVPGLLFVLVFKYFPMWGVMIAFKDYVPFFGFAGSEWVGLQHFQTMLQDCDF